MKRHLTALTTWILACTATVQANSTIYDSCYPQEAVALARVTDIAFPADTVCITRYGAIGDGQTLVTRALQQAIDDAARKGGGVVSVPQGVWLTGPIRLKSNVCLTLDDYAILQFSPDKTLYLDSTRAKASRVRPCISADKQRNIGITGNGIIGLVVSAVLLVAAMIVLHRAAVKKYGTGDEAEAAA
jgi:polygalacturonase